MVLKIEHIEDGHGDDTTERDDNEHETDTQIFILMFGSEWMIPPSPEGHYDDQRQDGALHESVTQAALLRDGPLRTQQQSSHIIPNIYIYIYIQYIYIYI